MPVHFYQNRSSGDGGGGALSGARWQTEIKQDLDENGAVSQSVRRRLDAQGYNRSRQAANRPR
jgi:hypothetical protein